MLALVPEERAGLACRGRGLGRGDRREFALDRDRAGQSGATSPLPAPQMAALERLLAEIMARWAIPPQRVIGHSDMAPGRKGDPGAAVRLAAAGAGGLSVWPEAAAPGDPAGFARRCRARFGYPEAAPDLLLAAFRLRFRPWARARWTRWTPASCRRPGAALSG